MNVILIGAQGSGKGTQAQLLSKQLHLQPCASGDMLRDEIARGTPLGRAAQPYLDRGDLVPDQLVIEMILERVENRGDAVGLILDCFPRTIPQAAALDERLAHRGQQIDKVIYLEVPRAQLLDRLTGRYVCRAHGHVWNIKSNPPKTPGICDFDGSELYQRSDDISEKIAHRLDLFFAQTVQVIEYYRQERKLLHIDGTQSIQAVHEQILAGLGVTVGQRDL